MQRARVREVAAAMQLSVGQLRRRIRDTPYVETMTSPELWALARLDRDGPATTADLARRAQITPQAMGTTVALLEERGFVARTADPEDGRRAILTPTKPGRHALRTGRNALTERITDALASFSEDEIEVLRAAAPLIERLAEKM
jgi:DNA-binding MarR family transcriptional regulator